MAGVVLVSPVLEVIVLHVIVHPWPKGERIHALQCLWAAEVVILVQVHGASRSVAVAIVRVSASAIVNQVVAEIVRRVFSVRGHARYSARVMRPEVVMDRNSATILVGGNDPNIVRPVVGPIGVALVVGLLDCAPLDGHVVG